MDELHKIRIDDTSEERYRSELYTDLVKSVKQSGSESEYLMESLGPTLVKCLEELVIMYEKDAQKRTHHEKLMKRNPSVLPRPAFNPLHVLASRLMQNNPKFATAQGDDIVVNSAYSFGEARKLRLDRKKRNRPSSAMSDVTEFDVEININKGGHIDLGLKQIPKYEVNFDIGETGSVTNVDILRSPSNKQTGAGIVML